MKNSLMRITALVLAMLVCLSGIACGDSQPTDKDTDTVTQDTTPEETTSKWLDSLPDKDMEGAEFNVLTAAEQWQYFYNAEETGDIVNDTVYTRNRTVEERFNCKINYRIYNGYMGGMSDVKSAITGSVMGGTMDFDLMVMVVRKLCSVYGVRLTGEMIFSADRFSAASLRMVITR